MDRINNLMQVTSLWNVLRTTSAWIPKTPYSVASEASPRMNNATENVEEVDEVGMLKNAELAAEHVLEATKDVLADLREQIVLAKIELEVVDTQLAEKKAELATTVQEAVDAALQRDIASADAEFLAWQRQELEPQVDDLRRKGNALQRQIQEFRLECEITKTDLCKQKEKMDLAKADLASKYRELASVEVAIDDAAKQKRTEQEKLQILLEENEKTDRSIQKLKKNYTALSKECLDMELQILDKADELTELRPLHEFHRKWLRGALTERDVFGHYTRCKFSCMEKEKNIRNMEKELLSEHELVLALTADKRDLKAALNKLPPMEESESEKKLAEYRAKVADCWDQMLLVGNAAQAYNTFLRILGSQMHETAVDCLSKVTRGEHKNLIELMATEVTGYKEAVHGRSTVLIINGIGLVEAEADWKKEMNVLRHKLQCLTEME